MELHLAVGRRERHYEALDFHRRESGPATDENDYQIKLRNILRFLSEGDKAKVTLRYRGRELAHQEVGRRMLDRLVKDLSAESVIEQTPLMEGKQLVMMFAAKKK